MNFLFQYEKNAKKKPNNRAYQELIKRRSSQRFSFTNSDSKQLIGDKKEDELENVTRLQNQTERLTDLKKQREVNSSLFSESKKQVHQATFTRNHPCSTETFYPSKIKRINLSEAKEGPDSFSSYIYKNKARLGSKKSRNNLNLRYFDLDEIVNQMASPVKLETKINIEQQKIRSRKNKLLDLNNFHSFLRDIEKDNTRYNQHEKHKIHYNAVRTQQNPQKTVYFIKKEVSQTDRRSLWRKNLEINQNKAFQNIIPWTQNQQQNSPLRPSGRIRTKAIQYSEAQIFKKNS